MCHLLYVGSPPNPAVLCTAATSRHKPESVPNKLAFITSSQLAYHYITSSHQISTHLVQLIRFSSHQIPTHQLVEIPTTEWGDIEYVQEENKGEEVAALGKCIDYFSDLVDGHWLGQKGLKIDFMEWWFWHFAHHWLQIIINCLCCHPHGDIYHCW